MTIHIPLSFVQAHAPLSWREAEFGYQNGWLDADAIIELAIARARLDLRPSPELIELASISPSLNGLIPDLLRRLSESERSLSKDKWLYLLLSWVYEKRDTFDDPLGIVEELYADFDYPESLASFVRYMPAKDPSNASEANLLNEWRKYLIDRSHTYLPRT